MIALISILVSLPNSILALILILEKMQRKGKEK